MRTSIGTNTLASGGLRVFLDQRYHAAGYHHRNWNPIHTTTDLLIFPVPTSDVLNVALARYSALTTPT
jgi:hypothetical protein